MGLEAGYKFWFGGELSRTPNSYEADSSLAYAGRRGVCRISHTDWGNAPMNFRLTATKNTQENLRVQVSVGR